MATTVNLTGSLPDLPRTSLIEEENALYTLQWTDWRVWDALTTLLPSAAASDDLGLIQGTFGTNTPSIQAGDLKAAGATTRRARIVWQMPVEYIAGDEVSIRVWAGMNTTQADNSATIDFEVYKSDRSAGLGSDLCTTAATSINSTTKAYKYFTIDGSGLSPGDTLDIRMSVAVNDAATATAVTAFVGEVCMRMSIRG